jgi:hypothetical protein
MIKDMPVIPNYMEQPRKLFLIFTAETLDLLSQLLFSKYISCIKNLRFDRCNTTELYYIICAHVFIRDL